MYLLSDDEISFILLHKHAHMLPSVQWLPWQYTYYTSLPGLTWVHVVWYDEQDLVIREKIHCILYGCFTLRCTHWWWPVQRSKGVIASYLRSLALCDIVVFWLQVSTLYFVIWLTQRGLLISTHTSNLPSYNKYWSENGLIKPKHVAKNVIAYILMLCCDWIKYFLNPLNWLKTMPHAILRNYKC